MANPLWVDLQVEFDRPDLLLQVLVLGGCVLVGWLMSQQLMKKFSARHDEHGIFQVPFDSFQIVLTPLLPLLALAAGPLCPRRQEGRCRCIGSLP